MVLTWVFLTLNVLLLFLHTLLDNVQIKKYVILLLSCECNDNS